MKVMLVYKFYLPNFGGIEMLMHIIARGLKSRSIDVQIVSTRYNLKLNTYESIDGIDVYRVPITRLLMKQIDIGIKTDELKRLFMDSDVIHVFSSIPSHILVSSLKLCRNLGKTCIWQPIYIPNRFKYHKSMVVRILGSLWDKYYLPRLTRYVHGIVALTSREAEFFERNTNNIITEVLGECVEEVKVNPKTVEEVLNKYELVHEGYILSVGRLTWYKGYDLLIDSWREIEHKYGDIKLVIVGHDWGYKRIITEKIRKYGLRNIIILEGIPNVELHALYEGCIAAVSLSRFETFHRIALEAWSHRKPIIALDLGPATEHITSDKGILVHDSVKEVTNALIAVIEDTSLRQRMGIRGYDTYKARYTVDSYVNRLLKLYKKAMEVE